MPQQHLSRFRIGSCQPAQAFAGRYIGKMPGVAEYALFQIIRVPADEQDLLFVVRFEQQQIGARDLLEYLIRDVSDIRDDADLAVFIIYGKADRIRRVVRDRERPYHEPFYVKILACIENALLRRGDRFFDPSPRAFVGVNGKIRYLFAEHGHAFHVIDMLVRDEQPFDLIE